VLQPFEQVESSLSRSHNGTGLGLPLTAAMMELHGGSIEIESEIEHGTAVTICFPPDRLVDGREGAADGAVLDLEDAAPGATEEVPVLRSYG
jgi:signal transduction histidine kinase